MSSSSDSEDDIQMRQFLAATDTTLLNNAMFEKQPASVKEESVLKSVTSSAAEPKSQRYLADTEEDTGSARDMILPEAVRDHVYKKMSQLLADQVEYCDMVETSKMQGKQKTSKSRVKLLLDAECYLKQEEEVEKHWPKGPAQRPDIKSRNIDEIESSEETRLQTAAVKAEDLLAGEDTKHWANKRHRTGKEFCYKAAPNGTLHAIETVNEFTQQRRKNKWHETKIKEKLKLR